MKKYFWSCMKNIILCSLIFLSNNVYAITCSEKVLIYGMNCTQEEYMLDLQQQQLNIQREQLIELRRQNKYREQQQELNYQMPPINDPRIFLEQLRHQRCLTLPLLTPGC